jgi:hypothetical protein
MTAKTSNDVEQATTKYRDSGFARMTTPVVLRQNDDFKGCFARMTISGVLRQNVLVRLYV